MSDVTNTIEVYLETGAKRTIACAIDWPGWCRVGRNGSEALEALHNYASRYARVLGDTSLAFSAPVDVSAFHVIERVRGNATTDYGVPDITTDVDRQPFDNGELDRSTTFLRAYWRAFDRAVEEATGKELRKGPRGGGREVEGIMQHVAGADTGYLKRLAQKPPELTGSSQEQLEQVRMAILDALRYVVDHAVPTEGPRGGKIWTPRYFVRRVAWHVLDHAWEIEDRIIAGS